METLITSSSPLLTYTPCKACDPSSGFATGHQFSRRQPNGTDSGMVTYASGTTVALNCTGTGVSFELTHANPDNQLLKTAVLVNGTALALPPSQLNGTSITGLPLGLHAFELSFNSSTIVSEDDWSRVDGAKCISGFKQGNNTRNGVVDDADWRDWKVTLTEGWNMVENGESNWIDEAQYREEIKTANLDWNDSISWTEQASAGNEIAFRGSAAWVYGIVGGEAGSYEVRLDNATQGVYNASGGGRVYQQLLYHTTNLVDGPHTLSLTNIEQGKRLSFDRLVAVSGLDLLPPAPGAINPSSISSVSAATYYPTVSATSSASPTLGAQSSTLSAGAVAGISITVVLVMAGFVTIGLWVCWKKRKESKDKKEGVNEKPQTTFFHFSSRASSPNTHLHPFQPLPSPTSHPLPTKPPFFHFPSPAPSLKSFAAQSHSRSHSTKSGPAPDQDGTSFLRLNSKRLPRKSSVEKKALDPSTISKPIQTTHIESGGFQNTVNPYNESRDYLPSLASGAAHLPAPQGNASGNGYSGANTPSTLTEYPVPSSHEANSIDRQPPLPEQGRPKPQMQGSKQSDAPSTTTTEYPVPSSRGELDLSPPLALPTRPKLAGQPSSLDPLTAALSGQVASPLAELTRKASVNRNNSGSPMVHSESQEPSYMNRMSEHLFGRRKGSISNSLDTRRWELETDAGTDGRPNSGADGDGILSMYANFPPGTPRQSEMYAGQTQTQSQSVSNTNSAAGVGPTAVPKSVTRQSLGMGLGSSLSSALGLGRKERESGSEGIPVGLALGSPMEGTPRPWSGRTPIQHKRGERDRVESARASARTSMISKREKEKEKERKKEEKEREREREKAMERQRDVERDIMPLESAFDDDDELQPPNRRFFGKAFGRPDSGMSSKSGKSASSVGSGWRYM